MTEAEITVCIELLDKYALPTIGAISLFIGVYLREIFLKKKDFELKYFDRVLEKKIYAHETLVPIISYMRMTNRVKELTGEDTFDRVPIFLLSKDHFLAWYEKFQEIRWNTAFWINEEVADELGFIQNYCVHLQIILDSIKEEQDTNFNMKTFLIGRKLQQEIFNISYDTEKAIYQYFSEATKNIKIFGKIYNANNEEHIFNRLRNTTLIGEFEYLKAIAQEKI